MVDEMKVVKRHKLVVFPVGLKNLGTRYRWKFLTNGRCVAKSDYHWASPKAARTAFQNFYGVMSKHSMSTVAVVAIDDAKSIEYFAISK